MFDHNLIVVSIFLGALLFAWAIIKFVVSKSSLVRDSINVSPCLSLKGKVALEPGVNVYLVAGEHSEIIITVNNRKFGTANAEVLSGSCVLRDGAASA